jgi:hypothetical protein
MYKYIKLINKIILLNFALLTFLTACGAVYLEYNSEGVYETPMMRYEIKQIDKDLHIKMTDISNDAVMKCELYIFFQDSDNKTINTKSYISRPLWPQYWQSEEAVISIPDKARKAYIRYNEYEYSGGFFAYNGKEAKYKYFSTIYVRLN